MIGSGCLNTAIGRIWFFLSGVPRSSKGHICFFVALFTSNLNSANGRGVSIKDQFQRSGTDEERESLIEETDESPAPPGEQDTTEEEEEEIPYSPVNYDTHTTEYGETESMETFPPTPPVERQNTRTVKTTETMESETSPPSPPDIQTETVETDSLISAPLSSPEMENTETEEDTPSESQKEEEARPLVSFFPFPIVF